MRFRLRTLLILLAVGPMVVARGYWTLDALRPKLSPWYIGGLKDFVPGPEFKRSREEAAMKAHLADLEAEMESFGQRVSPDDN
jgi:hypothetical protein